jgi:hypothetical protein
MVKLSKSRASGLKRARTSGTLALDFRLFEHSANSDLAKCQKKLFFDPSGSHHIKFTIPEHLDHYYLGPEQKKQFPKCPAFRAPTCTESRGKTHEANVCINQFPVDFI